MRHLRRALTLPTLAFTLTGTTASAVAFVNQWQKRREIVCDLVGAPVVVVESCETGVWLSEWGVE